MKLSGINGETMVVSMDAGGTAFEISGPWITSAVSVELTVEQSRELRDELDAYFGTPENVEESTWCVWCKGRPLNDHDCENFKQFTEPESVGE